MKNCPVCKLQLTHNVCCGCGFIKCAVDDCINEGTHIQTFIINKIKMLYSVCKSHTWTTLYKNAYNNEPTSACYIKSTDPIGFRITDITEEEIKELKGKYSDN